jgi:hypothetical protein
MSKRLVTGMVLALALTSTAAPAALADDQVTSVLTPSDINGPDEWQANQDAIAEALDSAKAAKDAALTAKEAATTATKTAIEASDSVMKLAKAVTDQISSLKVQLASLTSLMSKIAKKVGA